MSNLIKAKITVEGIRPLLQHRFTEAALPLEKQERTGVAGNDPEEWRKTAMVSKKGQLFIEPSYIFAALRAAARYTKKGKGSIQTDLAATLQVLDDEIFLENRYFPNFPNEKQFDINSAPPPERDKESPVYLDVTSVRNPTTKSRNVRYRLAASKGWQLSFTILWDKTIINRTQMEAIINDAGVLVGLADGRSIGFGRFKTTSFDIIGE